MKRKLKPFNIYNLTFNISILKVILPALALSSCIQTKTLSTDPNETLARIKQPLYCGTFSSFVNYDKNNKAIFNDSITQLSNQVYDSIIRKNFKRLAFVKKDFVSDSSQAIQLSLEFLNLVAHANKNESIKKYKISGILQRLTEGYSEERFMFMVPTGFTRSPENLRQLQKEYRKRTQQVLVATTVGLALATALSGGTAFYIFIPAGQKISAHGANCHILVYNKTLNEITFYRQQFFTMSNVKPLEPRYLKKQTEYLLKEYL